MEEKWDISNPPPEGHKDVAEFAWQLFMDGLAEKERLNLHKTWRANYRLFRGNHWGEKKKRSNLTINLFFSNVLRTVANITAREPSAECVDLDGTAAGYDKTATARLRKWWQDSKQQQKLKDSIQNMEVNGITIEKATWGRNEEPNVIICDPFSFIPAPGNWDDIALKAPYVCHAYPKNVHEIKKFYKLKDDVEASEIYSRLGVDRENERPNMSTGTDYYSSVSDTNLTIPSTDYLDEQALIVEVWLRDLSFDKDKNPKYPGGIRRIIVTNEGKTVCDDSKNPSINFEMEPGDYSKSYLFNRFPFWKANSYRDTTSIWGFSAAEQTADMNMHINEIISRLVRHVKRSLTGILIIPPESGIASSRISNDTGIILWPQTHEAAAGIRFLQQPPLSADFYRAFDLLISFYDRVYSIQDADRGERPAQVTAASAIVALQERNAVLIQHKINEGDYLVEQRGMAAISLWQNFGTDVETIKIDDDTQEFQGIELAGRNINFTVEAGSSTPKTQLQIQEQSQALYQQGAIDQQALLENINFPQWGKIVERMAEDKLGAAIQLLIQAGLPQEQGIALQQFLMQNQGGPGSAPQNPPATSPQPEPGTPKAYQGQQ